MIDFDIMGRESVVQEGGWEHEVVPGIPELRVILGIEGQVVSRSNEPESSKDATGGHKVDHES